MKRPDYRKRLLNRIGRLQPIQIVGVAKIMKIKVFDEEGEILKDNQVLINFIDAIEALTDADVKKYLKFLKGI